MYIHACTHISFVHLNEIKGLFFFLTFECLVLNSNSENIICFYSKRTFEY